MTQAPGNSSSFEHSGDFPVQKKLIDFLSKPADGCRLTRAIYLRALGVVYLCAFVSLWVQIDGLVGSRGILPAGEYLSRLAVYGNQRFYEPPTLCWINCSDAFLQFLCGGGVAMSLLLIVGLAPIPLLILLWTFYLSLTHVGQVFLSFQWDELLLEAGFLAIFFAPWTLRPRLMRAAGPSPIVLFLQRWLIFRVMIESGIVKMFGGDANWLHLKAMNYHYWTQPLPPWTAWYFAQLPNWFQQGSVIVVFIAELLVPLFYFWPRIVRLLGFWATLIFQCLILITGNYGFFNLLAIALCIPLTDDRFWLRITPRWAGKKWIVSRIAPLAPARKWRWPLAVTVPLGIFLLYFTTIAGLLRCGVTVPQRYIRPYIYVEPFAVANGYGLFQMMTTTRPEIIIEGSDDGLHWKPYAFRWKPGDVYRRPRFSTPHMPRLDWQMWFLALDADDGQLDRWVIPFAKKLLQGDKTVLALMDGNPFPVHPPKYLRLMLYEYRFTAFATDKPASPAGARPWWSRTRVGPLTRSLELDAGGNLILANE